VCQKKRPWDAMADNAPRDVATDHVFQTNSALRPALKVRGEPELTPRLINSSIWEPEYGHQRHPTNSPAFQPNPEH
jgi:hypothetical protein